VVRNMQSSNVTTCPLQPVKIRSDLVFLLDIDAEILSIEEKVGTPSSN
jgi:hypothetical protein